MGCFTTSPDGIFEPEEALWDDVLQENGIGYYKFRVRLLTTNVENYTNSDWSDFSPALDVKTIPSNIATTTVKTGDNTVLWFWCLLSACALLGMAGFYIALDTIFSSSARKSKRPDTRRSAPRRFPSRWP